MDMSKLLKQQGGIEKIKTPQSLVHIKHSITHRQYKYWYVLLRVYRLMLDALAEPDKDGFYYVPLATITEFLGYEPVKAELKKDFEALRQQPIIINYLEKDGSKALHGMGFVSEWKISSTKIGFKFPSFIVNAVNGDDADKKMFLLLNWNIFNSFTGKYEAIIYKLCKDYINSPARRTPYMAIEDYREYIGLSENDYPEMRDFTRRCVNEPIESINKNELSDISVSVEFRRNGRKIEGLYFKAEHKKQMQIPFDDFKPHPAFDYTKVSISPEQQTKYLEQYTPEQVQAIIERANDYAQEVKAKGKKANIAGIYKMAFTENWGEHYREQKQLEAKQAQAIKQAKETEKTQEKVKENKEEKEADERKKRLVEHWEAMTNEEKAEFFKRGLNNVPKVVKEIVGKRATIENAMSNPLLCKELMDLLDI